LIFLDSNIPMYLMGASHPRKTQAERALNKAITERARLVTDAAVFQKIMHRYAAIDRRDAIEKAFSILSAVVDEVFPINLNTTNLTHSILIKYPKLSARDSAHVACMQLNHIEKIMSFDTDFDSVSDIRRIF